MDLFYKEEKERALFSFPTIISPVEIAIFPLVNKEKMPEIAKKVYDMLKPHFSCFYDGSGAIGRRYRRQDEIGTPFCITIDSQTLKDNTVTIRERDNMKQKRLKIQAILNELKK
jgi:glycyl-tRNA synthetase